MNYKKGLLAFCLIICVLFCISSVAAGDVNDTAIASEDTIANEEILTANNEISDDTLAIDENNDNVAAIDEKDITAKVNDDKNDANSVLTVKNDEKPLSSDGPEKIKITVYKQTGKYASDKKLYFRATDSSKNPVQVSDKSLKIDCTVAGKHYKIFASTNSKGEGSFKWPIPKMTGGGTFMVKLSVDSIYSGCEVGYDPTTVKVSIKAKNTKQAATTKQTKKTLTIQAKKLSAKYKSGKKFKVKIIDSKSKKPVKGIKVTLKVDKKKAVTLKTNKNGIVSYSTKKLKVGNHKVVLNVKATSKFKKASKKTSIKITKAKAKKKSNTKKTKLRTKLTINSCYRPDYTQYYFKVTLKDSKGHKLANKQIQIATYISIGSSGMTVHHVATTDSNGVAEGYVRPIINGAVTYDATFKFAGDKSYYSSSAHKYVG